MLENMDEGISYELCMSHKFHFLLTHPALEINDYGWAYGWEFIHSFIYKQVLSMCQSWCGSL